MEAPVLLITSLCENNKKRKKKVEKRKNWKGVKAEAERHPLIMAVRAYCMWGKGSD